MTVRSPSVRIPHLLVALMLFALPACGEASMSGTAPPRERTVPFGQSYTYPDGVMATASPPTPFLHSEEAVGGKPGYDVRTTVKITNKGTKALDVSNVDVHLYTGIGAAEAAQYVDKANLLSDFTGQVPAGGTAEATYGFAYSSSDGGSAVLEVTLGTGYPPIAFEGSVI